MVLNHGRRERMSEQAVAPQGIYVTEDPKGEPGIKMWCGYCAKLIHFTSAHCGQSPFLSIMAIMAQAHRETECPNPSGPFLSTWAPRMDEVWWAAK
jgi:hypothetical protein